jgi:hypothetical protein
LAVTLNPVEDKDPTEDKLYTMDWSAGLSPSTTISTSSWAIAPSGLTNASAAVVTGNLKTSIRVSGGVSGVDYILTNTVTTSDSQTLVNRGIVRVV